jgi:hypothetical protein
MAGILAESAVLGGFRGIFLLIVGQIRQVSSRTHCYIIGAVLLGTFLLAVPPLIFLKFRKPEWANHKQGKENP